MKHKHAELIHAWADGAEIQLFAHDKWVDVPNGLLTFSESYKYRIKPKERHFGSSWLEDSTIVSIGGIRPKELKSYIESLERRISMLEASR